MQHQLIGKDDAETTERVEFNANKAYTITYDDLTPLTKYTFSVTIFSDSGVPSLPASISFKQSKYLLASSLSVSISFKQSKYLLAFSLSIPQ